MEKSAFFNNRLLPYLLLVPQLIITFVFFYWPASQAVWQSFLREDAFGLTSEFVGLENYQSLFTQPEYYASMLTTLVFSSLVAALSLSIALLFATQADNCSRFAHVTQALEKPQVAKPDAFNFLAASKTCGQVLGISAMLAFFRASLLIHITIEDELKGNDSISPFAVE